MRVEFWQNIRCADGEMMETIEIELPCRPLEGDEIFLPSPWESVFIKGPATVSPEEQSVAFLEMEDIKAIGPEIPRHLTMREWIDLVEESLKTAPWITKVSWI